LNDILKSFNTTVQKGYFPYSFVNKDNLKYIGPKPSKDFYNNISDLEYSKISDNNWDLKEETLKYLQSDIEGLLEVITKFRDNIFNKYNLNITSFKTLPSLAIFVYGSSYLPNNLKPDLKIIKGEVERELREAYFGGNVGVFINLITNGYHYDLNYQYSKAMLNDMPVGNPILSLETDLDKIFGFVYGEITCPDVNILQVPFIQYRDHYKNLVTCPRGKFKRLIFSQEIKYALNYGYKRNIEYCYKFKRGKGLFTKYVLDHFKDKVSAKDQVQRSIAKLFLNSLYGRLGMKDIESTMKIVNKKEADILDKNSNIIILSELGKNKYLVRYKGQISDNIRELYLKDPLVKVNQNNNKVFTPKEMRELGLIKKLSAPTAIHIAAAISSYARILINEYKNIPGNPCIMSDTDSAVLPYPLPVHLVGTRLGQMKLEQVIELGIFIKKKTYYIKNSNNKEVIKSSGVDSSHLNYELFLKLLKGETITIERTNFNVD